MAGKDPIIISDSDSDTLSESERPPQPRVVQAKPLELNNQSQASQSQHEHPSTPLLASQASTQTESSSRAGNITGTSSASLLSLLPDRRQLELERKERARKRRREQNLPSSSSDEDAKVETKRSKNGIASIPSSSDQSVPSTSIYVNEPSSSKARQISSTPTTSSSHSRATDPITPSSRFWTGTVKHSFNRYAAHNVSGVTISQMLLPATASSRNSLQLAVLATYDLRMDWLYSHFPRGLPGGVTLVLPPPKEDYRYDRDVARPGLHKSEIFGGEFARCPGWQICVPNKPKGGWLTQHMKFLVLVHDTFCRVAILSGNLNGIDWERIENTAFIQDFPLLSAGTNTAGSSSSNSSGGKNDFKSQLIRVLRSLSMPPSHAVYAALDKYDFSSATRARIVASWPEASSLTDWDRIETQGLGRLGKVVRDLGIKQRVEVECQGSSLTNHDVKWIEHFHVLASGIEPRGKLPFKGKSNDEHPEYARLLTDGRLHREYPETNNVPQEESTMTDVRYWVRNSIKALYHSPQSRRGDIMIHAKSILALTAAGKCVVDKAFLDASDEYISGNKGAPPPKGTWSGPKDAEEPVGWTYLGSSNFTRAAHGNITGTTAKPTMSSMNWEL
ncbi:tyrosyl-DNA phosphodiesterase [Pseudozyma hubeiensis SY62]|uniref:Tyrosyl-DNA phosphodiesterase n=1 Tax=Pseudozyma hubeiensis (strain SY62) TaxID=1305764 RepID=R9PGS9_PSEHS|nr:tyrosyl-DNA phosphodiesterase [Pseudozyma hubeiensis SY62]GAC97295.1 tyrosyl-DNA phosphodiesterase [Pseudozyma hubeiensis SY62]